MSVGTHDLKARALAEIDQIKAKPNAAAELRAKLAQAQVLLEQMEDTFRPSIDHLASLANRDPEQYWQEITEYPVWLIAQIESALAEAEGGAR